MFCKVINLNDSTTEMFECAAYTVTYGLGNTNARIILFLKGFKRESLEIIVKNSMHIFFMNEDGKTIDKLV